MTDTTIAITTTVAVTIIIFADGRMAEIIINSTAKPISADELLRLMRAHGVTAAKIIRIQPQKKARHRGLNQEGGGQSHRKGGQYGH
jgi:hypothetical protein